jgi:FNIP Repeat
LVAFLPLLLTLLLVTNLMLQWIIYHLLSFLSLFGYAFDTPINTLPPQLTHLSFDHSFNHPLNYLPPTLTHLTLGDKFNHPISFPSNITDLIFGNEFNQPLHILPPSLEVLISGLDFNQTIRAPQSLRRLRVYRSAPSNLPKSTHVTVISNPPSRSHSNNLCTIC